MFFKILAVAGLGTIGIHAAIPAGLAFQLSPWLIFIATVCGGLTSVYLAAFFGKKIRTFFYSKKSFENHPAPGFINRIWKTYGTIGLGLLGTMTLGATISIGVGLGLKVPLRKLITWCCIGVITRCAILTTVGYFGLKLV